MGPAIGPLTRLFTRKMYGFIEGAWSWDGFRAADKGAVEEMEFWAKNLNAVNGYQMKEMHSYSKVVYTDACGHGYGGYVLQKLGDIIAQGSFTQEEKNESSTYRELLAVKYVLESFTEHLQHQAVLWHSDNINVARILEVGSSKNHLQSLALDIYRSCLRHDINIIPKWLPREENVFADAISKHADTDDWSIDDETFHYIQTQFGEFDVDRFASSSNNKVRRFNSRYHCPRTETVNTFTTHWGKDFNWLCPPISLVGATLKHAKICKAKGVLFLPEWQSAYYWPLLTPNGKVFYPFVQKYLVLDPYYINNSEIQSVFTGFAKFRALALLIEF